MVEAENRSRLALLNSLGSWGTAYQTAIFTVLTEASAWSDNRVRRVQDTLEALWPHVQGACRRPLARLHLSESATRQADPEIALAFLVYIAGIRRCWGPQLSPCERCLLPTGSWCEGCDIRDHALCTTCEGSGQVCRECNGQISSGRQELRQGVLQWTRSNSSSAGQSRHRWPVQPYTPDGVIAYAPTDSESDSDIEV